MTQIRRVVEILSCCPLCFAFRFNRPPFGKHCKTFRRSHQREGKGRPPKPISKPACAKSSIYVLYTDDVLYTNDMAFVGPKTKNANIIKKHSLNRREFYILFFLKT
jgi:hypothetical protein